MVCPNCVYNLIPIKYWTETPLLIYFLWIMRSWLILFSIFVSIFQSFYEYLLLLGLEKTLYKLLLFNVLLLMYCMAIDFSFTETCIQCNHLMFPAGLWKWDSTCVSSCPSLRDPWTLLMRSTLAPFPYLLLWLTCTSPTCFLCVYDKAPLKIITFCSLIVQKCRLLGSDPLVVDLSHHVSVRQFSVNCNVNQSFSHVLTILVITLVSWAWKGIGRNSWS